VHCAEDRRRSTDAQRESEQRGAGKGRFAQQGPRAEPKILDKSSKEFDIASEISFSSIIPLGGAASRPGRHRIEPR